MTLQVSAQKQLRQFIEQIERLEEEKKATGADIRDKFADAKAAGFDVRVIRALLRLRRKSKVERQEEQSLLAVYLHALGMDDDGEGSKTFESYLPEARKAGTEDADGLEDAEPHGRA